MPLNKEYIHISIAMSYVFFFLKSIASVSKSKLYDKSQYSNPSKIFQTK